MDKEELGFLIEHIIGGEITLREAEEILEWKAGVLEKVISDVMTFKNVNGKLNTIRIVKKSKMDRIKISELEPSSLLNMVAQFQLAAGETLDQKEPGAALLELRDRLHKEECKETMDALTESDDVETLDGLCDIEVINLGSANATGNKEHVRSAYSLIRDLPATMLRIPTNMIMQNLKQLKWDQHGLISYFVWSAALSLGYSKADFLEAFQRVHESNMSKFCRTKHEAVSTVRQYELEGVETYYIHRNGLYIVRRRSDDKTLKSILYTPVQLADIVEGVYGK